LIEPEELEHKPEKHIINEVQLIFSEKRTALSLLRTVITVILLPLSVLTVLVATSRYYDLGKAWIVAIPLGVICLGLFILGIYLVFHSAKLIRKCDRAANLLLRKSKYLTELLDLD
jgi:hypothetical protein